MPALNVNTSVSDYLKSIGQDNSFGNRSKIYSTSGLNLGAYAGSAAQNTALLSYLQGNKQAAAPSPQPSVASPTPQGISAPPQTSVAPTTTRQDYVKTLAEQIAKTSQTEQTKVDTARKALTDYYANLEDPTARYMRLRNEQGVSTQEDLVNMLAKQALDQESVFNELEGSVNTRSGDFIMNDADQVALLARERQPVAEALSSILEAKQREEIGLSSKQSLVKDLLTLSFQGDERGAKAYQLGVDYTDADRKLALSLLQDTGSMKLSALDKDITDTTAKQKTIEDRAWDEYMNGVKQKNAIELENVKSKNAIIEKNSGTKKDTQQTMDAWNSILASSKTEYDVWQKIMNNQDALRMAGINVDTLWSKHKELAAKTGVGGDIRAGAGLDLSSYQ